MFWNIFSNVKEALKKVKHNSYRIHVLYYCNRIMVWLNLNFDTILTLLTAMFHSPLYYIWNFFTSVKWPLKEVMLHLCYYYNRLSMESYLNFEKILRH